MSKALPVGTVTFLFTDIEGSTQLLHVLGERYAQALAEHRELFRRAVDAHGGVEVDTQGDAFFVAFARARDGLLAAADAQRLLARHAWPGGNELRVRMGVHTGEPMVSAEGYVGLDVHQGARICAAGHGGQVLFSQATRELIGDEAVGEASISDLGEHRLKDLTRPQRLYQLSIAGLVQRFPALKTLDNRPTNLPAQATPFVGRDAEIEQISELLGNAGIRLLTLTGTGGIGKSRLAVHVAAERIDAFADGVFWVPLAPISDLTMVPTAIALALGVRESAGRTLLETLSQYLARRRLLLVLDNFEHVLEAAPVVAELLAAAPGLGVLVTSRAPLRLSGEYAYAVTPFPVPSVTAGHGDTENLVGLEAVRLFAERAGAIRSDFRLTPANAPVIASICARLDGLPLAIELAAARVRMVAPEALLALLGRRLDLLTSGARDRDERQRTLRATIDGSYEALGTREQELFAHLAVFVGGFRLEAAEAVCGEPERLLDVFDGVAALVEMSLLQSELSADESRFSMLETIREYALERLAAQPRAERYAERHIGYYVALAEQAEPELWGGLEQQRWRDRLQYEHDNFRAALERSLELGDWAAALRMAGALSPFWEAGGHIREGRQWLTRALAHPAPVAAAIRAKALWGAARLAGEYHGDHALAITLLEECIALYREVDATKGLVLALSHLAGQLTRRGNIEDGLAAGEESVDAARALGDDWTLALALNNFGGVLGEVDDFSRATLVYEEALALRRSLGERRGLSITLTAFGSILLVSDLPRARLLIEEGVIVAAEIRHPHLLASGIGNRGLVDLWDGRYGEAATAFNDAFVRFAELGDEMSAAETLSGLAATVAETDPLLAARLWAAAETACTDLGVRPSWDARRISAHFMPIARALVSDGAWSEAWRAGGTLSLEEAFSTAVRADSDAREATPDLPS